MFSRGGLNEDRPFKNNLYLIRVEGRRYPHYEHLAELAILYTTQILIETQKNLLDGQMD